MKCKSFDGDWKACEEQATMTIFWPGKTTGACAKHAQEIQTAAKFIGFALDSRPIVDES